MLSIKESQKTYTIYTKVDKCQGWLVGKKWKAPLPAIRLKQNVTYMYND